MDDFMMTQYQNFAFSGGGILGIAYLGMLDYLYKIGLMPNIQRVAGASAGAITACITAFNLSFAESKTIADSLDYSRITAKTDNAAPSHFADSGKGELDDIFGNVDAAYRLIKDYGWYSSSYFYDWLKLRIAEQFDIAKKEPPYTFLDFASAPLHKKGRAFKNLYVVGTDISSKSSAIFCKENTPYMEVAEAVRISMSVPLFFEAVRSSCGLNNEPKVYVDGGVMYNYPITLFDKDMPPFQTLGALFRSSCPPLQINNLLDFTVNLLSCTTAMQMQLYENSELNQSRSILIDTGEVASMDFNVKTGDPTYAFLYKQGYKSAEAYFAQKKKSGGQQSQIF